MTGLYRVLEPGSKGIVDLWSIEGGFCGRGKGGRTVRSIFLAGLLLAAAASAAGENVTLGGYEVSFDLGNLTGYELEFEEVPYAIINGDPYPSYVCNIHANGTKMMIALLDYGVQTEATISLTRNGVNEFLEKAECTTTYTRVERIDGLPAILGIGERPSGEILVCAVYWPDMREVNGTLYAQVDCTIASEASVAVTESLLNSIRVVVPSEEGGGSEREKIEL